MDLQNLKEKPLWQMTGEEFLTLLSQGTEAEQVHPHPPLDENNTKKYVYGIAGLARLLGCSLTTANRIKKEGRLNKAITQIGRKIIIDSNLALELAGRKMPGR